ncbi:hypothetical protein ACB358_26130, partial [Serratia nevei]
VLVNTEPYRSLLPHPVFKHNDYLGVTTILTQGGDLEGTKPTDIPDHVCKRGEIHPRSIRTGV